MSFGRKAFGRKGIDNQPAETPKGGGLFGARNRNIGHSPFDLHFEKAQRLVNDLRYPYAGCSAALDTLTPEERGELLADMVGRPGLYSGYGREKVPQEAIAQETLMCLWQKEISVRAEHLGAILALLTGDKRHREHRPYRKPIDTLLRLIDSAIQQGAYLSSNDCQSLAQMASDIRAARGSYSKAETKKMIACAERIEKLAGVEVSATEFLMQRCEGAENPCAIEVRERPNAAFWANLLAEVTGALEEIRLATKGSVTPAWARNAAAFEAAWPACGDVQPRFEAWAGSKQPVDELKRHNGKRNGWAAADAYRSLPGMIEAAQAHSRFTWNGEQIPGLDVLADLENPDWTALVEHLITQRRATKATATWQKEALALCDRLGRDVVETRLHDWLALFHAPALGRAAYTRICNGERFAAALDRLEIAHPDWPERHGQDIPALGRAIAMALASGDRAGLCRDLHPELVRLDDHVYKNKSATTGVLHMLPPRYKESDGRETYATMSTWMRVSVANEEFLRGAVWLVALMPDRLRAIEALEQVARSAATYIQTGDDGMRSKIVANAAIATLIALGGPDIDAAVLRLSKDVEHSTINAPLLAYLNA